MTGRERLLCALRHEEPDTVPIFECVYSRPLIKEVLGYVPETFDITAIFECNAKIGYDFSFMPILGTAGFRPAGLTGDIYQDEWGITYKTDKSTWPIDAAIKPPLETMEDFLNYDMPKGSDEFRFAPLKEVLKMREENQKGVIGSLRGPFSAAWVLFGMENFFAMMYEEPETVEAVIKATTDFAIEATIKMAEMGVDACIYSDDYGFNTQPLFSPSFFRQVMMPQLARIAETCKKLGMPFVLHSDGHLMPLIPDIMGGCGINGLHPIERDAGMDLAYIKKNYGKQVCIFGNIDNKKTLIAGDKAIIEAQVKECISIAAPGGGYCLGSDHSVHDDIPNENVFALYEAGRKYGKYPIVV